MEKMVLSSIHSFARYIPKLKNSFFFGIFLLTLPFSDPLFSQEKRELEAFIDLYFKSWSKGDMVTYKKLFSPQAVIQYREKNDRIYTETLEPFIEGQKLSQSMGTELLTEVPTSKSIDLGKDLSFARVTWKLTGRGKLVTGWDYFIILKTKEGYKIQYLLFAND